MAADPAECRARILAAFGFTEDKIAALEADGFGEAWQEARQAEARFKERLEGVLQDASDELTRKLLDP